MIQSPKHGLLFEKSHKEPANKSGTVFVRRGRVHEGRATQESRHVHSAQPVYLPELRRTTKGTVGGLGGKGRNHRRSKS